MAWRLTWTQFGKRQAMDYAEEGAAEDARMILSSNTTINGLVVVPVPEGEPADFSGPRQLGDDVHGVRVETPYRDVRWQGKRRGNKGG